MSKKNARSRSAVAQPNSHNGGNQTVTLELPAALATWAQARAEKERLPLNRFLVIDTEMRRKEEQERADERENGVKVITFEKITSQAILRRVRNEYFVDGRALSLREALIWYSKMQVDYNYSSDADEIRRFLNACAKVMRAA